MELRQLEHFAAVAEEESFTRAARRLNYVQSALSVSIRSLERELGVRLFDRTTHRVALTDAGIALLSTARRTLSSTEEIRDVAAAIRGVLRGTLRIGIMQSFTFVDVPGLLGRFHRDHPEVEIRLQPAVGGSMALLSELTRGELDLTFISFSGTAPAGLEVTPLASEALVLAASPERSPAGSGPVALGELAALPFIDFPLGWGVRSVVDRAFAGAGLERRVPIEVADVSTYLGLLRAGLGIALVPPSLLGRGDERLTTRALASPVTWDVAMLLPGDRTVGAARAFAQLVHEDVTRAASRSRGVHSSAN